MKPVFERLGSGSTGQTELSRADIGGQRLVVPSPDILRRLADTVWPLLTAADGHVAASYSLERLRDLVLPKLVTGQIDVAHSDLAAIVEKAAA